MKFYEGMYFSRQKKKKKKGEEEERDSSDVDDLDQEQR